VTVVTVRRVAKAPKILGNDMDLYKQMPFMIKSDFERHNQPAKRLCYHL